MPPSVHALACAERGAFADLLDGLTSEQWAAPSLCTGWSVRDVAAHTIAYLDQGRFALLRAYATARLDVDRLNERGLAELRDVGTVQLAAQMGRGVAPFGAGALYGCRVALIECVIHQLDIRLPLGLPRGVPEAALLVALSYARASPVIRTPRGIRFVATDLEWSAGRGPEVRGTGEALLLAMTGRGSALRDGLAGPGVALLSGGE